MRALLTFLSSRLLLPVTVAVACCTGAFAFGQKPLQPAVMFPGPTAVGNTSAPLIVQVSISSNGVASALIAVEKGTETSDYLIGGGGTCNKLVTYVAGQQCTISVSFQPQHPGLRYGAVLILAADGTLLGSTLLSGLGVGSLQEITPGGITTVAGNGASVFSGDGLAGTATSFAEPLGVAVDGSGSLYVSDTGNDRIRRVDALSRQVATIAGTGVSGSTGDGGAAILSQLDAPSSIAIDGAGNVFFADTGNHAIRRVDRFTGLITTVAGRVAIAGYSGDGGGATSASLSSPSAFVFDSVGNLLIADTGNNVIRRVDAATGVITTVAGTGTAGFNGDGRPATASELNSPQGVAVDGGTLIYFSDSNNNRIRRIDTDGTVETVAGNGSKGESPSVGGSALALDTELNVPTSIVFDPSGRFFFSDTGNSVVREVDVVPNIGIAAGSANSGFSGDGGIATYGRLASPVGLSLSEDGNIYVADSANSRIRELLSQGVKLAYPLDIVGTSIGQTYLLIENHGNSDLTLQTPSSDNAEFDAGTTCIGGYVIPPAHGCALFLSFDPSTVGDPVIGSVTWPSNAVNSPSILTLSGKVIPAEPSVTLTSDLNPSTFPATVTFTASVASTSPALGGLIDFLDGTSELCRSVLNNHGVGTCSVKSLTPGRHTIVASYLGDANDYAAVSHPLTQIVKQAVLLSLNASPNPAVANGLISLVSQVSTLSANTVPASIITFLANGTALGTASTDTNGSAILAVSLPAGTYSIVASIAETADFAASSSAPLTEVVKAQTVTILTGTPNPTFQSEKETLTATISPSASPGSGGEVTFVDGTTIIGTAEVDTGGQATFSTMSLAVGVHTLTALYSGSTNLLPSASAPITVVVAAQDFAFSVDPGITIQTKHHKNLGMTFKSIGGFSDLIMVTCGNLPFDATCNFRSNPFTLDAGNAVPGLVDIDTDAILNFLAYRFWKSL